MSVFLCPHCGESSNIFGHGGAKAEAAKIGVEFLGEIPLHPELRVKSDAGTPAALEDSPVGNAFLKVAKAALAAAETATKSAPEIIFD